MLLKTKKGRLLELPSADEDAAITKAALADPDAPPISEEEWEENRPHIRRGRPCAEVTKERVTIRLSPQVLAAFRATGKGWQTRMDKVLVDFVQSHSREELDKLKKP